MELTEILAFFLDWNWFFYCVVTVLQLRLFTSVHFQEYLIIFLKTVHWAEGGRGKEEVSLFTIHYLSIIGWPPTVVIYLAPQAVSHKTCSNYMAYAVALWWKYKQGEQYTHKYTHTHTPTHTHTQTYANTHTHSHTHARTHAHTHTRAHARTHTRTHTHTHTYTHTHIHTHTHTHTHTYIHTHTHTHTHNSFI